MFNNNNNSDEHLSYFFLSRQKRERVRERERERVSGWRDLSLLFFKIVFKIMWVECNTFYGSIDKAYTECSEAVYKHTFSDSLWIASQVSCLITPLSLSLLYPCHSHFLQPAPLRLWWLLSWSCDYGDLFLFLYPMCRLCRLRFLLFASRCWCDCYTSLKHRENETNLCTICVKLVAYHACIHTDFLLLGKTENVLFCFMFSILLNRRKSYRKRIKISTNRYSAAFCCSSPRTNATIPSIDPCYLYNAFGGTKPDGRERGTATKWINLWTKHIQQQNKSTIFRLFVFVGIRSMIRKFFVMKKAKHMFV